MLRLPLKIVTAFVLLASKAAFADCEVKTSKHRPLIELFTSEGCSSCPPADRWLSAQIDSIKSHQVTALAWHVDYWNDLGWKDPFSTAFASERQRTIAKRAAAQVYTPGVFRNGLELRGWSSVDLIGAANSAQPPPTMTLRTSVTASSVQVTVSTDVEPNSPEAGATSKSKLWVGTQRMQQEIKVPRGENAGRSLRHDFIVTDFKVLPLLASKQAVDFELAQGQAAVFAFLEHENGEIVQSAQLLLDQCAKLE
jgi:hypothetical protein